VVVQVVLEAVLVLLVVAAGQVDTPQQAGQVVRRRLTEQQLPEVVAVVVVADVVLVQPGAVVLGYLGKEATGLEELLLVAVVAAVEVAVLVEKIIQVQEHQSPVAQVECMVEAELRGPPLPAAVAVVVHWLILIITQ
jgi:hypothetical protein